MGFIVIADNAVLTWLQSKKDLAAKLTCWALKLQDYNFVMKCRRERQHVDADLFFMSHATLS